MIDFFNLSQFSQVSKQTSFEWKSSGRRQTHNILQHVSQQGIELFGCHKVHRKQKQSPGVFRQGQTLPYLYPASLYFILMLDFAAFWADVELVVERNDRNGPNGPTLKQFRACNVEGKERERQGCQVDEGQGGQGQSIICSWLSCFLTTNQNKSTKNLPLKTLKS